MSGHPMTRNQRRLYFAAGALAAATVDAALFFAYFLRAPRRTP